MNQKHRFFLGKGAFFAFLMIGVLFFNACTNTAEGGNKQEPTTVNQYTLTLDANGGTVTGGKTTFTVDEGSEVTLPGATRADSDTETFKFEGWGTTKTGTASYAGDAIYNVNADTTLYAIWTANKIQCTLTLDANGGTIDGDTTLTVDKRSEVTLPTATREDDANGTTYQFKGWATTNGGSVEYGANGKYTVSQDATIYAVWLTVPAGKSVYTLTYNYNYEGSTSVDIPVVEGVPEKLITEATRKGYDFKGWSEEKNGTAITETTYPVTADKTLYAVWEIINYTINYDVENDNPTSYTIETPTFTLTSPTERTGYNFDGWYKGNDKVTEIEKGSTGNIALKAEWNAIEYEITYAGIKDGDTNPNTVKKYTIETPTITLADATRKGYTFNGWDNGPSKIKKIEKGSTGDVTLTADWTIETYTITYNGLETGDTNPNTAGTYTVETPTINIADATTTRENLEFLGWYKGNEKVTKIEKGSTGDITLTAQWKSTATSPVSGKTAAQIIEAMGAGWNLGNTLDAAEAGESGDSSKPGSGTLKGVETETSWGMPKTTKPMIDAVAAAGFTHVRVPVSWHNHIQGNQSNGTIDPQWLARVKEIVDWVIDDGMYCVINIHHDTWSGAGTFWGYCVDGTNEDASIAYVENVWNQVATEFKDYDQRLVFETLNEPRIRNPKAHEWYCAAYLQNNNCKNCKTAVEKINTLNQKALDKIRAAGGNNASRLVIVPSYVANPNYAFKDSFKMPNDSAQNLLALSTHMYTPNKFAFYPEDSITVFDDSCKSDLDWHFKQLYEKFISKGIPVFIGEFSATNKNNSAERVKWAEYYVAGASAKKMAYCLWDNNDYDKNTELAERHGHLNRSATPLTWYDEDIIKAITGATITGGGNTAPTPGTKTAIDLTVGAVWNDSSATNNYTATSSGSSVILSHNGNITPEKQNWNVSPAFGNNSKLEIKITNTGSEKAFVKVSVQNSSYNNVITAATVNGTAVNADHSALAEINSGNYAVYVLTIGSGANQLAVTLNGEGQYGASGLEGLRSDMPSSGNITISDAYMY